MERRYLLLYLPMWSVNLCTRRRLTKSGSGHKGILLCSTEGQQPIVRRCDAYAARRGVREGMSAALARALAPDAVMYPFEPERDFRALLRLASKGIQYCPCPGIEAECWKAFRDKMLHALSALHWGIIMDISGTARLHAGEHTLAAKLLENLSKEHIEARAAVASTIGAAWGLSRYGTDDLIVVPRALLHDALMHLPLEALRLNADSLETLHTLGIYELRDLQRLPRKELSSRFGAMLRCRLDQAYGHVEERFHAVHEAERFHVERHFETHLVNREQVKRATFLLLEELLLILQRAGKRAGLFRLDITQSLHCEELIHERREIALHGASEKLSHMLSVIEPLVDNAQLCGTVAAIRIEALQIHAARSIQADFSGSEEETLRAKDAAELIDALSARIGARNVQQAVLRHSYIPEKSFSFVAASPQQVRAAGAREIPHFDRPPLLFSRPEAAQALSLLPDYPPSRITWRGREHRLTQGLGPERIAAEWWELPEGEPLEERDYFKVQDEAGIWLWVFRVKTSQKWFVHGVWT